LILPLIWRLVMLRQADFYGVYRLGYLA